MTDNANNYSVMNPIFTVSEVESNGSRSTIVIEPLESGYGHTLGNALRRVLLTSLPGLAITKLSIDGISHQFSTYEGLKEDVVDLILNLKNIRIKSDSAETGVLRLNVKGPKEITAKDIECEAGFEVINKQLYLATLTKGKNLNIEMIVEPGIGYKLASEIELENVGQIAVDALFSPVIKVAYHVEATRVGSRTDYDRIVFDIQTDGSITPLEAVKKASEILLAQFKQIIDPVLPEVKEELPAISPEELEVMRLTVEELDLPTRIANALRKGGYETVKDLQAANKTEISKVKNLGGKSIDLIEEALSKKGVVLSA
ncbi:MAG TPA: DNA-directed RNA polymerase subunit alpha [Candidatus Woesebacteria bacterium]|nr:DNA-directed RNA polymerase subunit alpha [Candidatus Woesebacteria bacterium]